MRFANSGKISIVIPVHNSRDYLANTVKLLRRIPAEDARVIIVDDGSTDGTNDYIREHLPDVVALQGDGNLWWSGAVTMGVENALTAGCDVVILWNDDNVDASDRVVDSLVQTARERKCCVSPIVLRADAGSGDRIVHAGGAVSWREGGLRLRRQYEEYDPGIEVERVSWLPGQALAVHESVFRNIALLDPEAFPQYRGDADFTMRVVLGGSECLVLNDCWVRNDRSRTGLHFGRRIGMLDAIRGLFSRRSNYEISNVVRFGLRHCPKRDLPLFLFVFYSKYFYGCLKTWFRVDPGRT